MMDLRKCKYCGQSISTTAMYCPACRKADEASINWLNNAKRTARSIGILGMILIGPNAVAGAILGPEMNRPTAKTIRKIAARIGAVDSVSAGLDRTVFFTSTGFVPMLLYDLGSDPVIPNEIPYVDFLGVLTNFRNGQSEVEGCIEYRTPRNLEPPRRPKPMERLLLGKELYARLLAEAEEFEKRGPPETTKYEFSFSGKNADAYAQLLAAKFAEYAGEDGDHIPHS